MQPYDIFMVTVLALAVVWGAWKGLAWQIASIASIFASYFVAISFRAPLARSIGLEPPLNMVAAMLILYLVSSLIIWVAFNMIRDFIEKLRLKEFDRQIGAVFGLAKGIVICVLITLFTVGLSNAATRDAVFRSQSGKYIAILLDKAAPLLPDEVRRLFYDSMQRLEDGVGHDRDYDLGADEQSDYDQTDNDRNEYADDPDSQDADRRPNGNWFTRGNRRSDQRDEWSNDDRGGDRGSDFGGSTRVRRDRFPSENETDSTDEWNNRGGESTVEDLVEEGSKILDGVRRVGQRFTRGQE